MTPASATRPKAWIPSAGILQRCTATTECEDCRRKRLGGLQRLAAAPQAPAVAPASVHMVLSSPGQPLDAAARAFMEPRFGQVMGAAPVCAAPPPGGQLAIGSASDPLEGEADALAERALAASTASADGPRWDFSRVRVHADAQAAESARAVNALAYTVGEHVVFDSGRYSPASRDGRRLLAHELVHTAQQLGPRLARQPKDKTDPLNRPLRPHVPQAPQMRSTDVPTGVTPCLTGTVCEPPVKGSAWDFGKQAKSESAPRPKSLTAAAEVKKAAEGLSPGVLREIFQVNVNPGLSKNVAAHVNLCSEFGVTAPDPTARCMEVPQSLETEASRFNRGKECLDVERSEDDPLCMVDPGMWSKPFIETMTHEAAHVAFRRRTPAGITSRTTNEITLHELSELYAQLSEFPVHYRIFKQNVAHLDPKEQDRLSEISMHAWVEQHAESTGEGFIGMLTKIRCLNECDKVPLLIQSLWDSVTAGWPLEVKDILLRELTAHAKLNWPLPPPSLRPPAEPHPKQPPLYQPRRTFVPELEKSLEALP